ncbi:pre-toxin TG domain-containing protein [Caldifermentibacillus hisashii]|uniref:Pre-toxin TG domain-containing protein n=1 Tax=Caldifermentibacillus hisashii TaxID=996558 RepID=A0ABU9K3D2_9BACI
MVVGASILCPLAALALGIAYGTLELESAVTGKDWISGRELGTGERVFRGVLAPLDIVPGVSGLSKFSSTVRLAHLGDMTELGVKTGLKAGIQRESRHVANMVIDAGKDSAARIRSAKDWAKEVPGKVKQKVTDDIIDVAILMDSTYTSAKNILPSRQMGLLAEGVGSIGAPAENPHTMENGVRALF